MSKKWSKTKFFHYVPSLLIAWPLVSKCDEQKKRFHSTINGDKLVAASPVERTRGACDGRVNKCYAKLFVGWNNVDERGWIRAAICMNNCKRIASLRYVYPTNDYMRVSRFVGGRKKQRTSHSGISANKTFNCVSLAKRDNFHTSHHVAASSNNYYTRAFAWKKKK